MTHQEIDQDLERIGLYLSRCQHELSRLREEVRTGSLPRPRLAVLPAGDGTAADPFDYVFLDGGD